MKANPAKRAKPAPENSGSLPLVPRHVLRLFVAGATEGSREAILRVRELCAAEPTGSCAFEVIDIYQQPALARRHQIVATPTLIRDRPLPMRRFIGNLANVTGLFSAPVVVPVRQARR
ncbi:MAG: circadian clock KaiB family protein [Planctomycetes bacterium]|nr:circadian clock KaiB family protein [Planctomycetota bacterium]